MSNLQKESLLSQLQGLNEHELRRLLAEHLTRQKVGLYWESNSISRDAALNADVVLPRLRRAAINQRESPATKI
jgi:adenine-specific DNA-methyltransferase